MVGRRVLACLQTIDIGLLTSDPVFLVPGGFIAVTGEGPIIAPDWREGTRRRRVCRRGVRRRRWRQFRRLLGGGDPVSVWVRLRRHDDPCVRSGLHGRRATGVW
jgi:hypothetical protein